MDETNTKKATFAAGCFWGVEAAYRKFLGKGVLDTKVGYIGGEIESPAYEQVKKGTTGHYEAVEVTYDPEKISYEQLLKVFWQIHDPTQEDGQGEDIGSQYMSAIFYHNDEQKNVAETSKAELDQSGEYNKAIVTEILPIQTFYDGEEYHQKYLEKNPGGYCHVDLGIVNPDEILKSN